MCGGTRLTIIIYGSALDHAVAGVALSIAAAYLAQRYNNIMDVSAVGVLDS